MAISEAMSNLQDGDGDVQGSFVIDASIPERPDAARCFLFGLCGLPTTQCCLLQEHELNSHGGHSQLQLHTPGTRYRLTLDLVILYTYLKHLKTHLFRQS